MAGIFDKAKHSLTDGNLQKRWKKAKDKKELNLPKKDFGTELDSFENSVKTANTLLSEINKLIEELKQEKQKCSRYAKAALNTAEFYKSEVPASETEVASTLDGIMADIRKDKETVEAFPTTLSVSQ
jgi:paraquat-inducible protein B